MAGGFVKADYHFRPHSPEFEVEEFVYPQRTEHSIRRVCERIYNDLKNAAINARGELVEAI